MQIQVNTDNHIQGSADLTEHVQTVVDKALDRFSPRVSRIEVHLSDENSSSKAFDEDKRCLMEARVKGMQPVSVSHQDSDLRLAISGAADKMQKTLKRTFDRLDDHRPRGSAAPTQSSSPADEDADRS